MAENVKTAVEAWEAALATVETSTRATSAVLKALNSARSNRMMTKAWDALEATRDAMIVAQEDEAAQFGKVMDHQRQESIDFEQPEKTRGDGPAPLKQEPLALPPGPAAEVDPDGEESADAIIDDDDTHQDDTVDEEGKPIIPAPEGDDEFDPDDEDEDDEDEEAEDGVKPAKA